MSSNIARALGKSLPLHIKSDYVIIVVVDKKSNKLS
jgi:hypothetical protein